MTEEVNFIRGNDRISQFAQRPDIAAEVAQVRADMAEAGRTRAMGLAALRQAAELTQVERSFRPLSSTETGKHCQCAKPN